MTQFIRKFVSPNSWIPTALAFCTAIVLLNVFFPMMTDEAYYMTWARRSTWPDWGFFDHPPFVSWQGFFARIWNHIFAARVGVIAASLVTFFANVRIAKLLFSNPRHAWCAAVVAQTTIGAMANAFLFTPDSCMIMWWSIALHESIVAVKVTPRRWLTAGLATGLGILSKYTMVLIGPAFLYGLIRDRRNGLKSPWPYMGGLVALLTIAPHLMWNAQHDWVSLKFQLGHGMSVRQEMAVHSSLPRAYDGGDSSPTLRLYRDLQEAMNRVAGFEETKRLPKPPKSKLERAWQNTGDFLGGVAGLWGVYAIWWLSQLILRAKKKAPSRMTKETSQGDEWHLVKAAFWFPLVFFTVLAPFSKIEANWPAMHMAAGAFLLIKNYTPTHWMIRSVMLIHTGLALVLVFLATHLDLLPYARDNRLVVETAGYDQLTSLVRDALSEKKLAVDSYQLKSAFAIRDPEIVTVQWPGITRPSEFTRGAPDDLAAERLFLTSPHFSLLSFDELPLELPGFTPIRLQGIRSCPDGTFGIYGADHPVLPCVNGLRDWWLTTYAAQPTGEGHSNP